VIIVMGEIVVEPGAADKVRDALAEMEAETHKEPGCITYAFSVDATNAGMVRISERWNAMEDIEKHMATPHMAKFMEAVIAIEPKSVDVKAFEVAKEVKLPG
jgi:quinol monooxygenase YgiN